jgi:hypothetical protein
LFGLATVLGLSALSGLSRRWREGRSPPLAATEDAGDHERAAQEPLVGGSPRSARAAAGAQADIGLFERESALPSAERVDDAGVLLASESSASVLHERPIHFSVETDVSLPYTPPHWLQALLPGVQHALGLKAQVSMPDQVLWLGGASEDEPEGQGDVELLAALTEEERDFVERCLLEALERDGPRHLPRGNLYVEPQNPIETLAFLRSREQSRVVACTSRYQISWVSRERVQWRASVSIPLVTPPSVTPPGTRPPPRQQR